MKPANPEHMATCNAEISEAIQSMTASGAEPDLIIHRLYSITNGLVVDRVGKDRTADGLQTMADLVRSGVYGRTAGEPDQRNRPARRRRESTGGPWFALASPRKFLNSRGPNQRL